MQNVVEIKQKIQKKMNKTRLFKCFALPPTTHKTSNAFSEVVGFMVAMTKRHFAFESFVAKANQYGDVPPWAKCQTSVDAHHTSMILYRVGG